MMRKIIGNYIGNNLKEVKFFKTSDFIYMAYATGKLIFVEK
jgi:hypothetical protein